MMKAIWNNVVLAESNNTVVVEHNHYFPLDTLKMEYFITSATTTHCPWKGDAQYYSLIVNEDKNEDAAWYYSAPKAAAKEIKNHVAFWRDVKIEP